MGSRLHPAAQGALFVIVTVVLWTALAIPVAVVAYLTLPDPPPDVIQGFGSDALDYWPDRVASFMWPWGLLLSALAAGAVVSRWSRPPRKQEQA